MFTSTPIIYVFQIRQTSLYDALDGFQLVLLNTEENSRMFLWSDSTVANCKIAASSIFSGGSLILWVGDVSNGITNGSDLLWADGRFVFTEGTPGTAPTQTTAGTTGNPATITITPVV